MRQLTWWDMKAFIYIVEPLYSRHNWFSEKVSAIKRCIHDKACTILLHQVKSIWSKLTLIWYGMIWYWQSCDSISTFKRSIIVLFNLDYHVGLSFLCFHWYKISQLCNKSWWIEAVRYTKVNFNTKCYWFHKMVSAMERWPLFLSAIKRFFYETMAVIPSVLMKSVRYREVFAIKHVRYREVSLYS